MLGEQAKCAIPFKMEKREQRVRVRGCLAKDRTGGNLKEDNDEAKDRDE